MYDIKKIIKLPLKNKGLVKKFRTKNTYNMFAFEGYKVILLQNKLNIK